MKFDIFKWTEEKPNEEIKVSATRLQVMCSEKARFYVSSGGYEVLAAVGHSLDVSCRQLQTVRVETVASARVFVERPLSVSFEPTGEVFTNLDRMPMESGAVLEVTRAMRRMKIEQLQMLREMKAERHELEKTRKASEKPVEKPDEEPADKPVVEPEPVAE